MEISDYMLEVLARERLAYAREVAARRALVPPVRRPPLRARLGATLIALGRHLLQEAPQRAAS